MLAARRLVGRASQLAGPGWLRRCSGQPAASQPQLFDASGRLVAPEAGVDHFAVFGLERRFALEAEELQARYKALQKRLHPDLFTLKSEQEQQVSLDWSSLVNMAYSTLSSPLPRALYLLQLVGHPLEEEGGPEVPPEFLMEVMELNEEVSEAGSAEVAILGAQVRERLVEFAENIDVLLANQEYEAARVEVAHMKYFASILDRIVQQETEFGIY